MILNMFSPAGLLLWSTVCCLFIGSETQSTISTESFSWLLAEHRNDWLVNSDLDQEQERMNLRKGGVFYAIDYLRMTDMTALEIWNRSLWILASEDLA